MSSPKQLQLRPWIKWTWIIPLVALIDQITKQLIVSHMNLGESYYLTSFLNLTFTINQGAAFSFLNNAGGWQIILFSCIAIVAIILLFYWLLRLPQNEKVMAIALCLIIGGAVGNLIDRLDHRYVVDFVDFHIKSWHFAIFNIADAAVSIGAFIIIIRTLFSKTK
jgi:signal peptidase II